MNNSRSAPRRLRLGMVGGGTGAYIGNIHRVAARLDGQFDLIAGAFEGYSMTISRFCMLRRVTIRWDHRWFLESPMAPMVL